MAWTEADKVKIRHYLGFGAIFVTYFPMLESALQGVLSRADGGNRPDNSTELHIRAILTELDGIEADIAETRGYLVASKVSTLNVDAGRAIALNCREGRRKVAHLAIALGTDPKQDVFGPLDMSRRNVPFDLGSRGW